MRPTTALLGLLLVAAPAVLAQGIDDEDLPNLSSQSQPNGNGRSTAAPSSQARTSAPAPTSSPKSEEEERSTSAFTGISIPPTTTAGGSPTSVNADPAIHLSGLPTIAGVGIPDQKVPDTAAAPFMQKSDLPDGTVFICVGAVLAFLGAAVLAWRGLVAWSLHRSVKRAAMAQNLADLKAMSAVPGKKRGLYNVVGASSNMSLDRLSAAPTGTSKPSKPFAAPPNGTPPKSTSLFFSPTAGGATGLRDSVVNRSSNYLPAGYYPTGTAQPASGSPMTHVGGPHLSTNSLATPGNRFSTRSGISPPGSPSLPPSRGYDRAPPSRDGISVYQRNSVATLGNPGNTRSGVYSNEQGSMSQLSLNVPGGTTAPGGRAPSAYLEDLFENHGTGPSPQPR